jgi:hypothetical protein
MSHDIYQYDNPIRSKYTGACHHQHWQQLLGCVDLDRVHLQEVEEQKLCL